MIKGNKGEWSELYVLLYLLGVGKLYAANDKVEKIEDVYFPILKILRNDSQGKVDYLIKNETEVEILLNDNSIGKFSTETFRTEANHLYNQIKLGANRAFSIDRTESFMNRILAYRLAAPSTDKTDITLQVHDINTGYNPIMGFSIKSELGNPPTLLNASGATNFIYEVKGISDVDMERINSIDTRTKILDRINEIYNLGGSVEYKGAANDIFAMNLMLIDSRMEDIIAAMLLYSYRNNEIDCTEILKNIDDDNPLNFPREGFYSFKFKKLLSAIALGMKPSALWDGIDEANGGYIIVASNGDVLAYHLYNRNFFEQYLLDNTRLERASTSRHGYASIYKENDKYYIKLNLQIRFK